MPPSPSTTPFFCSICCEDQPPSAKCVLTKCSHECCTVCLHQVIQACDQPRPLCPFCRTKLAKKDIRAVVSRESRNGIARELAARFPPRTRTRANEVDDLTRMWIQEHTRPCPSCGSAIERTDSTLLESSNEMMRCNCGCLFCYSCGSESRFCSCSNHARANHEVEVAIEDILLEQERNTLLLEHAQNTNALVSLEYDQLAATSHSAIAAEEPEEQPQRRAPSEEQEDGPGFDWTMVVGREYYRRSATLHSFIEAAPLQTHRSALARLVAERDRPAIQEAETEQRRPKTTYRGVSHNSGTGKLCLTDKGLIYYPSGGRG